MNVSRRTVTRVLTGLVACSLVATATAHRTVSVEEADQDRAARAGDAGDAGRFVALDVVLTPGDTAVAAYQLSIPGVEGVALVGVEGGAAGSVFAEPPVYDPAALAGADAGEEDKNAEAAEARPMIVLAAFSLEGSIDARTRVARLHLHVEGGGAVDLVPAVLAAGSPGGDRLEDVRVSLQETEID